VRLHSAWSVGGRKRGWGYKRRYRARCGLRLACLLQIDLFLELLAELTCHSAGTAYPPAYLGSNPGQLFGPQHDQGQDKNNDDL
jgi:hypothetical protein